MKLKFALFALAFLPLTSYGTTMQIWTGGTFAPDANDLKDFNGDSIADLGRAAYGVYNGDPITDAASLAAAFTMGADSTTPITNFSLGLASHDGFTFNSFDRLEAYAEFGDDNTIAVVFWKGLTNDLSMATEATVLLWTDTYDTVDDPTNTPREWNTSVDASTLIFGTSKTQTGLLTIPEPSSITLLGIGSVALLLRRRR